MLNDPEDEIASRWLTGTVLEKSLPKSMPPQAYQIRYAELTDIPGIIAGVSSLLAEIRGIPGFQLPAEAASVCQRVIEGKYPGAIFVANPQGNNDSIIGLITLTLQESIHVASAYILIQELWVHPDHRSQNIGENLIQAVETYSHQSGISRVGLIDIDFHFGNGSAAILASRPDVWFGSIHRSTILSYPYKEVQPASDRQTFISFSHSPSSEEYLTKIEQLVQKSLDFGCAAIVVSVGYDIIINDPHGGWHLQPSIFEDIGRIFAQASIPLCLVQEGGYLLNALGECAYKFGSGLLGKT